MPLLVWLGDWRTFVVLFLTSNKAIMQLDKTTATK